MKIRYFIESALRQGPDGQWYFTPIGVWAHGQGWGLNVCGRYVPDEINAQEQADGVINNLVEQEVVTLPEDWLRRKAASIGLYQGDASLIYITEGRHSDDVAERILAKIIAGGPIGDLPLMP